MTPDAGSSPKSVQADDRRSEPRFPANAPVEIHITYPLTPGRFGGSVVDLSKSGLRLRVETSLPKGSRVQVKFGNVVVFGEIRHCHETEDGWFEAGVRIEDLITRVAKQGG